MIVVLLVTSTLALAWDIIHGPSWMGWVALGVLALTVAAIGREDMT